MCLIGRCYSDLQCSFIGMLRTCYYWDPLESWFILNSTWSTEICSINSLPEMIYKEQIRELHDRETFFFLIFYFGRAATTYCRMGSLFLCTYFVRQSMDFSLWTHGKVAGFSVAVCSWQALPPPLERVTLCRLFWIIW